MKCHIQGKAAKALLKAAARRNPNLKIARNIESETKSKYGNRKTEVDGIVFASKREADRYVELKYLERAGEIKDLRRQKPYDLVVNGILIARYVSDFCYTDTKSGERVVEDAKGYLKREYIMKKRLMLACHGIEIVEV